MLTHSSFLQANSEAYEWMVEKIHTIDRRIEPETVLRQIVAAARFAAVFHPGRFADGTLENLALDIGAELDEIPTEIQINGLSNLHKQNRRRVLHVATEVLGVGGHTRMLYHWVCNDYNSCHSLVLVNQRDITAIPNWLSEAIQSSGGELVIFPAESELCQKARWLRATAKRIADLVVLHHCPFDVVPTVAFAIRECPPIAILNHADHLFWLGSSVADIVINLRTAGSKHTAECRFIENNTVIPIPLAESTKQMSRKQARQMLGIEEDQCMLLSVGRGEKYRPCGAYDFVATANKILDHQTIAHLYVVGETAAGIGPYLNRKLHNRLHFMGSIENPSLYLMAADVYLESFPFGSNTALLEAALCGLPVVPAYAPLFPLLVANNDSLHDILSNPLNEEEYIDRVDMLIRDSNHRTEFGEMLRNRLLLDHTTDGWLRRLAKMYEETDFLMHSPKPIPIASFSLTNADIGLSLWHIMANGKSSFTGIPENLLNAVLCHTSFVAKEVGNYTAARRNAWLAVRQDPLAWSPWRLLGITTMGKTGRSLRQLLSHAKD
ncbi:MAG: glycosyltransferase family 4 protein [Methylobacter sp.]|uniref:Glycosyltransferase family 4 protein n=1 Tax=Candidatus Methylobacter titanis TaxID=3053457 RepID=A0AA43Q7K1_9GAMM|nr:glycosyltransferase family 4 protein [Candidatus Methylobacter titanis]